MQNRLAKAPLMSLIAAAERIAGMFDFLAPESISIFDGCKLIRKEFNFIDRNTGKVRVFDDYVLSVANEEARRKVQAKRLDLVRTGWKAIHDGGKTVFAFSVNQAERLGMTIEKLADKLREKIFQDEYADMVLLDMTERITPDKYEYGKPFKGLRCSVYAERDASNSPSMVEFQLWAENDLERLVWRKSVQEQYSTCPFLGIDKMQEIMLEEGASRKDQTDPIRMHDMDFGIDGVNDDRGLIINKIVLLDDTRVKRTLAKGEYKSSGSREASVARRLVRIARELLGIR